jgi:hypothetical protein
VSPRWNRYDRYALGGLLALPLLWYFAPLFTNACYYLGDLIGQYDPWWTYAHESFREGRFPLWNPYVFGGTPYHVNPENALFYPLKLPLLFLPFFKAAAILRVLNTMVASAGAYLLLRGYGTRPLAGVVGALIFSYGSFMAYEWIHIPYVNTAVWFPWQLLFLERVLRRRRPLDALALAVVTATSFLGGSPGVFLICQMTLAFYLGAGLLRMSLSRQRGYLPRVLLLLFLAVALVVGLTAILLVPAIGFIELTPRAGGLESPENFHRFSTLPEALTTLVFPWTHERYGAPYPPVYPNPFLYIPYLGFGAVLLALFNLGSRRYAWLMPVTLSVVAFSALAALGTNAGLLPWLMQRVTLFGWFRWPHDYLLMSYLALSIAAATGFDALWRARGTRLRRFGPIAGIYLLAALFLAPWRSTFLVAGAVVAIVAAGLLLARTLRARWRDAELRPSWLRPAALRGALGAVLLLLVAADLHHHTRDLRIYLPREALRADHASAAIDWLRDDAAGQRVAFAAPAGGTYLAGQERFFSGFVPLLDEARLPGALRERNRELTRFDRWRDRVRAPELDGWIAQRRAAFDDLDDTFWTYPVNAGMRYRYEEISGYDPFVSARVLKLFRALPVQRSWDLFGVGHVVTPHQVNHEGLRLAARAGELYVWKNPDASPRVSVPARVEGNLHPDEILRRMAEPGFHPARVALFEARLPDSDRVSIGLAESPRWGDLPPGAATLIEHAPERVLVHAEMRLPGYVVLHDVHHPGWKVLVDDEPAELLRADYLFRAVRLTPGRHTVEFVYRPRSFVVSASISILCWTGSLIVLVFGFQRRFLARARQSRPGFALGRELDQARAL